MAFVSAFKQINMHPGQISQEKKKNDKAVVAGKKRVYRQAGLLLK